MLVALKSIRAYNIEKKLQDINSFGFKKNKIQKSFTDIESINSWM